MQAGGGSITLDEFRYYGRQRFEVVEGRVVIMQPDTDDKPRVITRLLRRLERYVRRGGSGELLGETSFILDGDPAAGTVSAARRPDLAFVSRERIEAHAARPGADDPWWLAPDLAVEIVSAVDRLDETNQKVADYLRFGVRLVWVVDPVAREVRVYTPDAPVGHNVFGKDLLSGEPVIAGWAMEAAAVFGR